MKVYIEVLVVLGIILVVIIGSLLKLISGWIAKRRYKPENDRSRLGEEQRRRDSEAADRASSLRQSKSIERRSVLPLPNPTAPGESSPSVGGRSNEQQKTGRSPRGIFTRFRRRG